MVIDVVTLNKTLKAGIAYHDRAKQFIEEGMRWSLVFNVASVALEQYLIALCELNGDPPADHDLMMLTDIVDLHMKLPDALKSDILAVNKIFGICCLEEHFHGNPEKEHAELILKICEEIYNMFDQKHLKWVFCQKTQGNFLRLE